MILKNEFACVSVDLDDEANGERLAIRDSKTDQVIYLDPLELETLAWAKHEHLSILLDPSFSRWKDEDENLSSILRRLSAR